MKIDSVTAHPLRTALDTPFAFSQGWVHARSATLVEIRTDNGLVGWGEAFCQGLEVPTISATVIRDCFADMIHQPESARYRAAVVRHVQQVA